MLDRYWGAIGRKKSASVLDLRFCDVNVQFRCVLAVRAVQLC